MIEHLAAVSGKIQAVNGQCVADGRAVSCPSTTVLGLGGETPAGTQLDLLPPTGPLATALDTRNNPLFLSILALVVLTIAGLSISRVKLAGRTIGEYLAPIWPFVVVSLLVVGWQYLVGVEQGSSQLALRTSQWIWELAVAASAVTLVRRYPNVTVGNLVVLGLLYSLIIHGTKVTVRYLAYDKTFLYVADRFLYGSLLVLAITLAIGFAALELTRRRSG